VGACVKGYTEASWCRQPPAARRLARGFITPEGTITPVEINATVLRTARGLQVLTLCRDTHVAKPPSMDALAKLIEVPTAPGERP
jgi:hypothetical protein